MELPTYISKYFQQSKTFPLDVPIFPSIRVGNSQLRDLLTYLGTLLRIHPLKPENKAFQQIKRYLVFATKG